MKLRYKILIAFIVFIILALAGIIYLNKVYLPTKIKSLIVESVEESTHKNVSLDSVQFNIFKGLVIRGLKISEGESPIVNLKEGSCTFLLLPVFKKILILPTVNFNSATIFLERRKDKTFNIEDLFPKGPSPQPAEKSKFDFFVYRVSVRDAEVRFRDDTFPEPLTKILEHLDLTCYLSLPAKVRFNLKTQIQDILPVKIRAQGEYRIQEKELDAKMVLQDLAPGSFLDYYQNTGMNFSHGLIDSQVNLKYKDDILSAGFFLQSREIAIDKKRYTTKLNCLITANAWYDFKKGDFDFNGNAKVADSGYLGLNFIGPITAVNGEIAFNKAGMHSDKLTANIWGVPVEASGGISDFDKMLFEVQIKSDLGMPLTQSLLKDKLKFNVPAELKGNSQLFLTIQNKTPTPGEMKLNGFLLIAGGQAKLDKVPAALTDVSGRIEYREDQVTWPKLSFKYLGIPYVTKGSVIDFNNPKVLVDVSSKDLNLLANFTVSDKLVNITNFSGHYLNSTFSLNGTLDSSRKQSTEVNLKGSLDAELDDLSRPFDKLKAVFAKAKPAGKVHADFVLTGNTNDLRSCAVKAVLNGKSTSFFGLRTDDFRFNYNQSNGLIDIPVMHIALYGGSIDATLRMDTTLKDPAYWLDFNMQDIDLKKLKADTLLKDEDIEGVVDATLKANGPLKDLSAASGTGTISINDGKLWELDLFKGLGALLLVKDFAKIVFRQGDCNFLLQDKTISTNKLTLKSAIMELFGPVKIGLADNSIDATLEVNVIDEMVPLTGTFRDVTTAIVGQAGRFGVIRITGTMKEPKFKFKAAVADLIKGLTNTIFGKPSE